MGIYKEIVSPVLDRLDSETWHVRAREGLHRLEGNPAALRLLERFISFKGRVCDERLNVVVGGVKFDNPVMVGAGWDKEGRAVKALYVMGFSGVEVGSVLAQPQFGNPKPRQEMVAPGVCLNSLGFNSSGVDSVLKNLKKYQGSGIPIGISIGKNKDVSEIQAPEVYASVAEKLWEYAAYIAVNVSSPNTPGLRKLQDKKPLIDIVQAVKEAAQGMPIFVKIAPDLTNEAVDDVIDVVLQNRLAGMIATNTTNNPDVKAKYGRRGIAGGISGDDPEFRRMATEKVAHIYKRTRGENLDIIGVGGVKDAATAIERVMAGARGIQLVTPIRGEGPWVAKNINRGLVKEMDRLGVKNISELVGMESRVLK